MKFFGVHIEDLESDRFLAASNDQIATWLFLHALCSKQTNGGTIADASTLPERFWSRHGIDYGVLRHPSPLWFWEGETLTVEPYDIDGQRLFEKKSRGGKEGAAKRWKGSENRSPKGSENRSPKGSLDRPDPTRPNPTRPDISSSDDGDGLALESISNISKKARSHQLAEAIYREYPRKVAKKPGVEAIIKAMKGNSPEMLLERTKSFAAAVGWKEKTFIPHPATWFNEERFNDDPEDWKQPTDQTSKTRKTELSSSDVGLS